MNRCVVLATAMFCLCRINCDLDMQQFAWIVNDLIFEGLSKNSIRGSELDCAFSCFES